MTKINYQALREAAEKATWGDWDSYKPHRGARGYEVRLSSQAIAQHVLKNNAEFIAAFNPKVALALLDERERNLQYIKSRDQENEDIALTVGRLRVEMEAKDKAWSAQDNHINQQADRIETLEKKNGELGRALEAAEKRTAELESLAATQLPQPAVVVSEAQSKKLFDEWSGGDGALGELRASGVPDEFISMLKEFSLATWEACREAMLKHSAPFIVTSDHRMMEMPAIHDIDAVSAMLQGADASITHEGKNHHKDKLAMVDHSGDSNNMVEPVTTTYKLPFEQWLSKQTGTIDVECGCVMTEVFYHWLRVAYEAGNSPVTPDGWISCSERMPDKLIPVMVMYEDGEMWSAMWNGNRWDDGTEYPDPHSVTHWREMPAAPQQEVK